jgi:hypothetical protein
MQPDEPRELSEQNKEAASNAGPDETAPDSETQSSASSAQGNRETPEHKAPNDPAEGPDL